jgi:hypothetical protein
MWSSTIFGNAFLSPRKQIGASQRLQETPMKITVIKKTNGKVKTMGLCPWILDEPSIAKN